jgi:hypothetical protein
MGGENGSSGNIKNFAYCIYIRNKKEKQFGNELLLSIIF